MSTHIPTPPAAAPDGRAKTVYIHRPRHAVRSPAKRSAHKRWYGDPLNETHTGVGDVKDTWRVMVARDAQSTSAKLRLYRPRGAPRPISVLLDAPALLELARCLIDAAYDIDGGEA